MTVPQAQIVKLLPEAGVNVIHLSVVYICIYVYI